MRRRSVPSLTILCYHRVSPELSQNSYHTSAVAVSHFCEQMNYLRRRYEVLPLKEGLLHLEAGRLPRRAVAITFDDGYLELMETAFPVLRDLCLPATVFLVAGYVGTDLPFWWEEVAFRLRVLDKETVSDFLRAADLQVSEGRLNRIPQVINALKSLPNELRERCLGELRSLKGEVLFSRMSLSWEEVRKAQSWGISFGSHSLTHPNLSRLSDDALAREMQVSRVTIESMTQTCCCLLAYPNGDHDDRVRTAARRAGYRWACTMERGGNTPATDPFMLRRHPVYAHHNHHIFAAALRGWLDFPPWIFTVVKAVGGGKS